jgi:hypothetical protein
VRIDPRAWIKLPAPTLLLGLFTGTLLVAPLVVLLGGTQAAGLLATPARAPAPLTIDLADAPAMPDLGAIQSQPLMYSTRAFYVAPAPDTAPTVPPLPDYRFAGAFIVPNKPAVALLSRQGAATRRVRVGEDLDGWRVQAVESRRVLLQWQDQQREIGAQSKPMSAGLRRVPMQRQRVASAGGIQTLGSPLPVSTPSANPVELPGGMGGPRVDVPRLYTPPPPN